VHQRELVAQDPWVVFPGNTQGRHARETGPKGCTLVQVEDGRVVGLEHRPLDVVRWTLCPVDLTDAATLEEVEDRVEPALRAALAGADGRLPAVRIRLCGPCAVHPRLHAERERVVNACRALAGSIGAGEIWVEQVLIDTRGTVSAAAALARDDAFGGLLRAIRGLDLDPERLAALAGEVADLGLRLPPELCIGDDAVDPTAPEYLRGCLEDVQALLLDRLLGSTGGGSE
jgi:hypothetical protein